MAGWRGVFQRRIAKLSGVKNASKTRNSPRWANKILNPLPENPAFSDCKKFKPKSVIRLAECVSCFRRGMLLCILFASVLDVARYAFG